MSYSIEKTQDEFGNDKWFVVDENGDWPGDAHDDKESARAEMIELNAKRSSLDNS